MTHKGIPDGSRAARLILKDYVNGKLLYCYPPPGYDVQEFQQYSSRYDLHDDDDDDEAEAEAKNQGATSNETTTKVNFIYKKRKKNKHIAFFIYNYFLEISFSTIRYRSTIFQSSKYLLYVLNCIYHIIIVCF